VVYAGWVERLVTVVFGPSRSTRFAAAVAEAEHGPGQCSEIEPGRYRVRFVLDADLTAYTGLARLLERVRHWRASEVTSDHESVSAYHAREMAWCASSQLNSFGECRFRFYFGLPPRCSLCPLFNHQRATLDLLGESTPAGLTFEITLSPELQRLLGEHDPPELDPDWQIPDYPPQHWQQPGGEQPAA
jgi:hypothetical protein